MVMKNDGVVLVAVKDFQISHSTQGVGLDSRKAMSSNGGGIQDTQIVVRVWKITLDQIVTYEPPKDIPTLEDIRNRVKNSGLL